MSSVTHCSECGAELPTGLLGNRCPRCVLQLGLAVPASQPAAAGGIPAPERPPSALGRVRYFGDYELLEEIARGGMGIVYKARQVSLNRLVAVKMILFGEFARPPIVQRFRREAEAAARLQHPNIVAVHEVGEHEGQQYFSMDYVEGPNLTRLVGHTPLPAQRAARYVQILAEATHYAHQHGVLHRDLKPSNVLIDPLDQPRITDFGLARRFGVPPSGGQGTDTPAEAGTTNDLTLSGQALGSPNYLPPEQAAGRREQVGPASDVYGLGAILYYLLTGRPPFVGETVDTTLAAVLNQEPVSPRSLHASVPRDLETICLKCLEKDPVRRYPTAQELAEELGRFLRGQPVRARPIGPVGKVWRWCRRRPARAGLIAALIAVFALGLTGVLWQWRQAEAARRDALQKLWGSYLAQARANRWSGRAGQRFDSLAALTKAAAIRPTLDLRNEAIACLALPDAQVFRQWPLPPGYGFSFEAQLERYARADEHGHITLYRVSDGVELLRLPGSGKPQDIGMRFSPDGRFLAGKWDGPGTNSFRVWDLTRQTLALQPPIAVYGFIVQFAPDSRSVAAAEPGGTVHVYDLPGGMEVKTFSTPREPSDLRFDLQGTRLAVCNFKDPEVRVFALDSGQITQTFRHPDGVSCAAWNHDGRWLACAGLDQRLYLWDVLARERRAVLEGHTAMVKGVAFSRRGDLLVSGGWDGKTLFWDPILGRPLFSLTGSFAPPFSPDDTLLGFSTGSQGVAWAGIWQVAPARECRRLGRVGLVVPGNSASFSPDGRLLAVASRDGALLWDLETSRQIVSLPIGDSRSAIFDPEGRSLITSGAGGVQRWPLSSDHRTGTHRFRKVTEVDGRK